MIKKDIQRLIDFMIQNNLIWIGKKSGYNYADLNFNGIIKNYVKNKNLNQIGFEKLSDNVSWIEDRNELETWFIGLYVKNDR